jgi:glycosyltransferase involved in cell wall biosynthesis
MRVAHFIQRYPPALGGSEAWFGRLSRHLSACGDSVTVFTTTALDLTAFWSPRGRCLPPGTSCEDGVTVRRYPLWRMPGRRWLLKPLSLFPHRGWQRLTLPCNPISGQMWRDASGEAPFDLVHAAAFPYAFPIACALRLARHNGLPFLLTPFLHLGDPDQPRDRTRRGYTTPALLSLVHAADRVFVQTELERDFLIERGVPPQRLVLLGMGVEPPECTGGNRPHARRQWGAADDEVVVGHLANLSAEKGTIDLLRAADSAWQAGHRFRIVLAGPHLPAFERFWRAFGPRDRVHRLGVLDEQQKRDFFAGIDLFALPSRSDSFGLVLLEAWANGVANVAYRAGGVAEVIRHETDGLLVHCGDLRALAEAIVRLVQNAELRRRLGLAGFDRIGREFRWTDRLERVRQVYRECAEWERNSPGGATIIGGGRLRADRFATAMTEAASADRPIL